MIWFVKMPLELPRATLLYRREYKQVKFIRKVRMQHDKVSAYFIIIDKFKELYDDIEFFVMTLEDLKKEDIDEDSLVRFYDKGVELGIFNFVEKESIPKETTTPAWQLWENE